MESSAGEWFDSDESEFQMRTALRNSTVLSPRARLVLETLMVLMSLAAVTGNFLVIVIVAATKTFHTVTSVLIINLAISDFLVGIGVMPFVAVSIMNNGWVNYNDLCLYVGYTSSVYCTASVLTLAAIALDRYFSIVDCLRYGSRCTIRRTGSVVICIWLQAMLTSCPPLFGWSNISFVAPMYSCAVNWAKSPSYTVIMASLSFLLPAIVILFCYVKIVRVARYHARKIHSLEEHLQRNRATSVLNLQHSFMDTYTPSRLIYYVSGRFVTDQLDVPDEVAPDAPSEMSSKPTGGRLHSFMAQIHTSSPQHPSQPQHHGVLRLFLVIAAFFLCWTPYISVALVQATETALSRPRSVVPPSAVTFSYWLVLFNSDINPLLYALLSKRFQGAFQSLRWKIQARLGCVVEKVGAERSTGGGESDPTNRSTHTSTAHSRNDGESTYSSVFALSSQFPNSLREQLNNVLPLATCSRPVCHECGGRGSRAVDHLQVPYKQRERNRLPYSAATKKKQATFFYGQITTHMLSVGDSVQEFLLRRLSGELREILSELMELAQVRSGVFNVLIQHCCETWLPAEGVQSDAVFSTALLHLNILTEACVYGPVFRRDQRLVQEVQSYVEQFGDTCAANTAVSSDNRDNQFPRVCALAFLCRLNPSNRLHQRLMEELVQRLLRKDAEISKSKVRYYSNSIQHRVKNRVWQTLLLLLHKLRLEFVSDCVLSHVCEAGFCSNQASVKYLIEWTLILILHLNPSRIQNLWNCFSLEHEKTRTSICTFFSVLVHLNVLFPKLQDKEVQWRRAVEVSLQWCFSHNFCVRLYALLALKRVWELEDARALEENLGGLTTVVQACLQQAEAMQNTG
ncbi:unnamed protein product [Leuciscus chuanchicus]